MYTCRRLPPHLNIVSTLPCETWNAHCNAHVLIAMSWHVRERNCRIYPTSNVTSKFPRFEPSWLLCARNTARKGVQSTYHWSGRTERATENGVDQAGSRRHCGSHSSVASSPISVRQGWWQTFWAPSLTFVIVLLVLMISVADVDDMNSYALFVRLFLHIVRSGVVT